MAKETDRLGIEEGKQQIARTRADLDATISELKGSLRRTRDRVDERVRDQTSRRVHVVLSDIDRTGREVGRAVVDALKESTIPLSVTGLGIGWLVFDRMKGSAGRERRREDVGEIYPGGPPPEAVYPRETAYRGYYGQGAEAAALEEAEMEGARGARRFAGRSRASKGLRRFAEDHPLVIGLGAVTIGAAIGYLLPSTRREDAMMGEKREAFLQGTKKVGRSAVEETKSAFREAADAVQEEADKSLKGAVKAVKEETAAAAEKAADATSEEIRRQTGAARHEKEPPKD